MIVRLDIRLDISVGRLYEPVIAPVARRRVAAARCAGIATLDDAAA
jgi:hypothetical protein